MKEDLNLLEHSLTFLVRCCFYEVHVGTMVHEKFADWRLFVVKCVLRMSNMFDGRE